MLIPLWVFYYCTTQSPRRTKLQMANNKFLKIKLIISKTEKTKIIVFIRFGEVDSVRDKVRAHSQYANDE